MHEAEVSFGRRQARVSFEPAEVTVDRMIEALERLGYQASVQRIDAGAR